MIFVVAHPPVGRLIKPQINFFQAHDIPVYATSHIYSGKQDPVNDTDLDQVVFGDMPWLLVSDDRTQLLRQTIQPYENHKPGPLDRLFALGMDAYSLSRVLPHMQGNQTANIPGATATLVIRQDRRIQRQLTWARFDKGVPVILEMLNNGETDVEDIQGDQTEEERPASGAGA